MARAPRSNNAKTKAKINADDRSRRKAKLRNLRTFLLIAFTVTSVASPSAGLAAMASIGAFDETRAPRTSPRRPSSSRRPSADELKKFAAELVDKRLGKLETKQGKAMLKGNNAQDAIYAVISLFFARLDPGCARTIFEMTRSGESFETLEDLLRLNPKAAKRAVEAYTKIPLGVYYYEVPFFEPGTDIVNFYQTYRSDHIKYDTTKFGPRFITKCRRKWNARLAARVRYVGKRASKHHAVIQRGVDHFDDECSQSGARFFSPAARRVPKLYDECDAKSCDARGVTAALLLDDLDVCELAKTLRMEPEKACEFAETVMMALLRTRCCDEDGGCGTNIDDGFGRFESPSGYGTRRVALIERIVPVVTANTGWMSYKAIANAIGDGITPAAVGDCFRRKDRRVSMFMFDRSGKQRLVRLRVAADGDSAPPKRPRVSFDRIVAVVTANTGWMSYEAIANAIGDGTTALAIGQQLTRKANMDRVSMFMFDRSGKQTLVRLRGAADGEASAPPKRLVDRVVDVVTANTGWMSWKAIANEIGDGITPNAIRKQLTRKDRCVKNKDRVNMLMFDTSGKQTLVKLRR